MKHQYGTYSARKLDCIMTSERITDTVNKLQNTSRNFPKVWDGRDAILEMKDGGSTQWRQMDWILLRVFVSKTVCLYN